MEKTLASECPKFKCGKHNCIGDAYDQPLTKFSKLGEFSLHFSIKRKRGGFLPHLILRPMRAGLELQSTYSCRFSFVSSTVIPLKPKNSSSVGFSVVAGLRKK